MIHIMKEEVRRRNWCSKENPHRAQFRKEEFVRVERGRKGVCWGGEGLIEVRRKKKKD